MNVEKISKKKVSALVAEQIEKMIESRTFKPGDKLPSIRELCEIFDVGRSAVRDAINTLTGKGMVNVKQGEGTYICEFDSTRLFHRPALLPELKNVKELFQVRKILEAGIAEAAALNRTLEDLKVMEGILSHQVDGWEADYQFHKAIAKASGNDIIIQLMEMISSTTKNAMIDFHNQIQQDEQTVKLIMDQHQSIYEAIELGEPQTANEAMIQHLSLVEELLEKALQ